MESLFGGKKRFEKDIALMIREESFTSELFKDILEAVTLILRYRTLWWLELEYSITFTTSDVCFFRSHSSFLTSWILSSFFSERVFFWTILMIVSGWLLLSLCVLFGSSCCVLGCVSWVVVGGNRVVNLIGNISMYCSERSSTSSMAFEGCVVVVSVGAGRSVIVKVEAN